MLMNASMRCSENYNSVFVTWCDFPSIKAPWHGGWRLAGGYAFQ